MEPLGLCTFLKSCFYDEPVSPNQNAHNNVFISTWKSSNKCVSKKPSSHSCFAPSSFTVSTSSSFFLLPHPGMMDTANPPPPPRSLSLCTCTASAVSPLSRQLMAVSEQCTIFTTSVELTLQHKLHNGTLWWWVGGGGGGRRREWLYYVGVCTLTCINVCLYLWGLRASTWIQIHPETKQNKKQDIYSSLHTETKPLASNVLLLLCISHKLQYAAMETLLKQRFLSDCCFFLLDLNGTVEWHEY